MLSSIDSNVIIRSIIDEECKKSYLRFCNDRYSFLCFTINSETEGRQLRIFSFFDVVLSLLKNKEGVDTISKRKFFTQFSKEFKEIFEYIKDNSDNLRNVDIFIELITKLKRLQRDFIDLRNNLIPKKMYPETKEGVKEILQKQDIKEKFKRAEIIKYDRIHLCLVQDYGSNIKIRKVLFVTFDKHDLIKHRDYLEKIFDFVKIVEPGEYDGDF